MPVSYSKDLRGRVIAAWLEKEGSIRQLAQRFNVVYLPENCCKLNL